MRGRRRGRRWIKIDGEIDALGNEASHLEREHDRKIVLAHAVREADHRFREDHQPDVVRRAPATSPPLPTTGTTASWVGDSGEFYVRRSCDGGTGTAGAVGAAGATVAAEELSTGAREQLYLAMRLAIMSHLDHDRERLPVFIDEALVNWDAARRGGAFSCYSSFLVPGRCLS